jgi:5,10-methylenetetrahydromethanopterin reductase
VREQIAAGAAAAGRSVADLDIAACLWTAVDDDRAVARGLLARQIARYAGSLSMQALAANGFDPEEFARTQRILDSAGEAAATAAVSPRMLDLGIAGSAADVIDGAAELLAMGVRHLSFGPPLGTDRAATLRLIGTQVLPALRRMRP